MSKNKLLLDDFEFNINIIFKEYGLLRQFEYNGYYFIFSKIMGQSVNYNDKTNLYTYKKKDLIVLNCSYISNGTARKTEVLLSNRNGKPYLLRKQMALAQYYYDGNKIHNLFAAVSTIANNINNYKTLQNTLKKNPVGVVKKVLKV